MQQNIRQSINTEEFESSALLATLRNYSKPRDKVSSMIRKGEIIQMKKGVYIWGDIYRRRPVSVEILSNIIYGPSYISLDYALSYYDLIPEHVYTFTALCLGRDRAFSNQFRNFIYKQASPTSYYIGIDNITLSDNSRFQIATREKALADKVHFSKGVKIDSQRDMGYYLFDSLRIDPEDIQAFDLQSLQRIAFLYRSKKVSLLNSLIARRINSLR